MFNSVLKLKENSKGKGRVVELKLTKVGDCWKLGSTALTSSELDARVVELFSFEYGISLLEAPNLPLDNAINS